MSTPLPFNPAAHFSSLALPPSIIHPSVTCPRGPFDDDWSLKHIFLPISFPLNPSAPRPSPPLRVYHFLSKPSRISVCFRAVSSTNLASTFSCSSKGFGPARSQKETEILIENRTADFVVQSCFLARHARTHAHTFCLNPRKASI